MALSLNTQENVLTVLCFGDSAGIVGGLIKPVHFDNEVYRLIAERAVEYYHKYKKPPKTHIVDLLEAELSGRKKELFKDTINDLYQANKDGFNEEFVINGLREFSQTQRLKTGILKSAKLLQGGKTEQAKEVILKAVRDRDDMLRSGLTLKDSMEALRIVKALDADNISTGITALDRLRIGLARKTLFLLMANTNRGKTWGLIQLGKACLMQRLKVAHITLEMSEEKILARYLQTLFSMRRHKIKGGRTKVTVLKKEKGTYVRHRTARRRRLVLSSRPGRSFLRKKLHSQYFARRLKLIIKEFPPTKLTTRALESYLDFLERHDNFVPDVLILDYPDLMEVNIQYLRIDTGRIYKEIRAIGVERNIAVAAATQANRAGEEQKLLSGRHAGEDYSKMTTADTVVTYSQTALEEKLNLARLYVWKARDEKRGDVILLSQAYELGQFHIDSARLPRPAEFVKSLEALGEDDDEE